MRKKPLQLRSRMTVDALVEAAAQTIVERGLRDTTTNHVAARAGVSVGSLYQYFESKDALIDALLDRSSRELTALVDQRLAGLLDADPRTVVADLLTAVFDFLQDGEGHHLELLRNWQQLRGLRAMQTLERHMLDACRLYLLRHVDEIRIENLPAALFVIVNGTLYTIVHYLGQPRPQLRREEVIASLSDMIAAYTRAPQAAVVPVAKRPAAVRRTVRP